MFKKVFGLVILLAASVAIYSGCVSTPDANPPLVPVTDQAGYLNKVYYPPFYNGRFPSAENHEETLKYFTYNPKTGEQSVHTFAPVNWQEADRGGERFEMLKEMYFANTRTVSRRKMYHLACYTGAPDEVLTRFFTFNNANNSIPGATDINASISSDGTAMGIQFNAEGKHWFFRLISCASPGKNPMFNEDDPKIRKIGSHKLSSALAIERAPAKAAKGDTADKEDGQTDAADGFVINDTVKNPKPGLPTFAMRADYDNAPAAQDTPWLDAGFTDIMQPDQALKLSLILQKYAYEGMVDQNKANPDLNFIAQNNKKRFWCHMPWLNQGANGREAVHGLTQERNLQPSHEIWPHPPLGADWGIGMFNAAGCKGVQRVFGTMNHPVANPNISHLDMQNGSVVFKILFTTADFPEDKGAYTWMANVGEVNSNARSLRPVHHIQMDIGIKDTRLKGFPKDGNDLIADGWLMTTYYYDPKYTSPLAKEMDLPAGMEHMRPMGIQAGFTPNESVIFEGSKTNQDAGMLNGPADNPKSSCLSCHAVAGTNKAMAPGVTSTAMWRQLKKDNADKVLDFGQQFALARRNFETRDR